jgi:hypothetical protein
MIKFSALYILSFALVLGFVSPAKSQEVATQVDEFGELCSDEIRGRIDSFFVAISDRPNSTGYVVGFPNHLLPGRYDKFVRLIRNHIAFRNFYPERVKFLRGSNREEMRIQFWLVPPGAPSPDPIPGYSKSVIVVPTLFDASAIDSIEKGNVIFGEGGEPCDFGLDVSAFAREVISDNNLIAVLMATSDRRHSARFVRKVLRLTQQQLTHVHGIQLNRIKVVYAGGSKQSEMQLWMVPRDARSPQDFTSHLPN